ncbi:hypothetical protein KY362_04005 [Candidatus Woesearchaeota archaeon]|nr:hypothetical protein [Candidatus Woesearchaeota archaeon]
MKMFNNKRGIELSVNFIVMLILAIAVFAGGLVFASKFFGHAEKVRASLDAQTERQIEKLLDSGSPVVLPINTKEIFRNKHDTFGAGVLARYPGDYILHVQYVKAIDKEKNEIQDELNVQYDQTPLTLKKNEKGKYLIMVEVPKQVSTGTYIYKLWVQLDADDDNNDMPEYDDPLQMIIKVP